MSHTAHVNVSLCTPRDRIVVLEAFVEEAGTGSFQVRHAVYPVVAITARGHSNSTHYNYLINYSEGHVQGHVRELTDLTADRPFATYTTLVCPGPEAEDRKIIAAAIKVLIDKVTTDHKVLRNIQ